MRERTTFSAAILSLIGAVLIFLNVLAIVSNGSSIIVSSYSVSSIGQLLNPSGSLWYRIAFGVPAFVEGPLIILWLMLAVINLTLSIFLYLKPERPIMPSFFILIFSLCLYIAGGGFIIGSLLGIIGSSLGLQSRKDFGETFFGKLFKVATFDSKVFGLIKENPKLLREATMTIIFITLLSGLGCSLYIFNANQVLHSNPEISTRILLHGETLFDASVLNLPITYIGLSIIKWILLSLIVFLIGSKLLGITTQLDAIARSIAFAYVPVSLQVFLPFVFLNQPFLTIHWPLAVIIITNLWMILVLVVAIKQLFEVTTPKAVGIVMLSGSIYWPLTYKFILPMVFTSNVVPGVFFDVNPNEFVLLLISLASVLSFILGVFTKD